MASATGSLTAARDARKRAQDLAWQDAVRLSTEQKSAQEAQATTLASEAFVNKRQQERVLPNVMAKAGLSGQGYTETTANNIGSAYQKAWTDIITQKQKNIAGIDSGLATTQSTINQNKANIEGDYQDSLASYYASQQRASNSGSSRNGTNGTDNTTTTTNNPLNGALGNTSNLTAEQIIAQAGGIFTDMRYKRAFWAAEPGFDAMLNNIRSYLQTVVGAKGVKLSAFQIDKVIQSVSNKWNQYRVDQQRSAATNRYQAPTNNNNPAGVGIPGGRSTGQQAKIN